MHHNDDRKKRSMFTAINNTLQHLHLMIHHFNNFIYYKPEEVRMPQRRRRHNTKLAPRRTTSALVLILASLSSSSTTFYACHAFTTRPAAGFVTAPKISSTAPRIPDASTAVRVFSSIAAESASSSTSNNTNKRKKVITAQTGNKRLAGGMAAMTGWADVMLHAQLGTFCTMMTGNALWLAKAVSECQLSKMVYYTSVIAAYCSGLAFYRILQVRSSPTTNNPNEDAKKKRLVGGRRRPRLLEKMAGVVAALFVTADLCLLLSTTTTITGNFLPLFQKWIPACLLATGFAMVNGVGSDFTGGLTFVVTGHLTKFTQTLVDTPRSQWKDLMITTRSPALAMNVVVMGGFLAGALWGNIVSRKWRWITANFTWMGLILSGLFLWKDSLLRQAEREAAMVENANDDDGVYQKTSKPRMLKQFSKVLFQKPASDEEEVVTMSSTTSLGVPSAEADDPVVMSSSTTTTPIISSPPPETAASTTAVEEDEADYSEFATKLVTSAAAQNVNATMQLLLLEHVSTTTATTTNSTRSNTSCS